MPVQTFVSRPSMKRYFLLLSCLLILLFAAPAISAQTGDSGQGGSTQADTTATSSAENQAAATKTQAAAVVVTGAQAARTPDFLEHLVDEILALFNVRNSGNTATRYVISLLLVVVALLLRRVVVGFVFNRLKKLAAKTTTTLDDKLFPALEGPAGTFVVLVGLFAALKVLKLSATSDQAIGYGSTVAFSLVLFWGLLRAFNALLDHAQEIAVERKLGVAAFMPWIKKTLVVIFVIFGVLLTAQSLGADVKAFLAGLGIGGLAFALAAQDTIANVFGSIVVAIDQPFKIGEMVKIGSSTGTVEDIGLRSTKIRLIDRSLVIIPNKTVAAESVTNLSRFTARRVEQTLNLTYDTSPEKMETFVRELRELIKQEPGVDPASVLVTFAALSASSLDVLVVYMTTTPDAMPWLMLRERLNLAVMRLVAAHGLSFAFPTQTLQISGFPPATPPAKQN